MSSTTAKFAPNSQCASAGARDLVNYWLQARGVRDMPARGDIDAAAMRAILPHVQILEVIDRGRRFYTRVSGSAAHKTLGYDPTGSFLDEYPAGAVRARTMHGLRRVLADRAPMVDVATTMRVPDGAMCTETVMLPLSRDGIAVDMVLVGSFGLDPVAVTPEAETEQAA